MFVNERVITKWLFHRNTETVQHQEEDPPIIDQNKDNRPLRSQRRKKTFNNNSKIEYYQQLTQQTVASIRLFQIKPMIIAI